MTYTVTITRTDGQDTTYLCGGGTDQEALIYAGKVVEINADRSDPNALVKVCRDSKVIGPTATVAEMTSRAV